MDLRAFWLNAAMIILMRRRVLMNGIIIPFARFKSASTIKKCQAGNCAQRYEECGESFQAGVWQGLDTGR